MFFRKQRRQIGQALCLSAARNSLRAAKDSIRARFARRPSSPHLATPPVDTPNTVAADAEAEATSPAATTPPSHSRSPVHSSTHPVTSQDALQNNRVSIGIQASSSPPTSIRMSTTSLSSDSSPSSECITPSAADAGLHRLQTPQVVDPDRLSPLAASLAWGLPLTPRDIGQQVRALDATSMKWSKYAQKAAQCAERVHSLLLNIEGSVTPDVSPLPDVVEANTEQRPVVEEVVDAAPEPEPELRGGGVDPDSTDDLPTLVNPHTGSTYKVHGFVGEGGFGRVFKVTNERGRSFAAKTTHKRLAFQYSAARQSLANEMSAMLSVLSDEPNNNFLVRLIESWEDGDNIYFIMVHFLLFMLGTLSDCHPSRSSPCTRTTSVV